MSVGVCSDTVFVLDAKLHPNFDISVMTCESLTINHCIYLVRDAIESKLYLWHVQTHTLQTLLQ